MPNENQHWVSKFLIRHFADMDGRVFCLDIHTDEVTKPPPKRAASDEGFNDFTLDGETISFEDRLERIETKAAPILKQIVATKSLAGVDQAKRQCVAEFTAAQSFRTKAFREGLINRPNPEEFGHIFKELWGSAFITSGEIARRHWALMIIEGGETFYLGDNPVVLQRTENPKDGSNLGFDVEGVEAFMPLSPKCSLYMPSRVTSDDIIERYNAAMELHRTIRFTALRGLPGIPGSLELAQLMISRLYPLVQAFKTGKPISANQENIDNLNYLQCSWSHAAIYSNRRDFAFARRVFRENPNLRTVPGAFLARGTLIVPKLPAEG